MQFCNENEFTNIFFHYFLDKKQVEQHSGNKLGCLNGTYIVYALISSCLEIFFFLNTKVTESNNMTVFYRINRTSNTDNQQKPHLQNYRSHYWIIGDIL